MFGLLHRCQRLERRCLALERDRDAKAAQHMAMVAELEDARKCIGEVTKAYQGLKAQCGDSTPPTVAAALRDILDDLGGAEWGIPEHAEEVLREIIHKHYLRGHAALIAAEGA